MADSRKDKGNAPPRPKKDPPRPKPDALKKVHGGRENTPRPKT